MNQPISANEIATQITNDIQACNTLIELLDREQDALQARDVDALADIIEKKAQPLNRLEESGKQRAVWANVPAVEQSSKAWNAMLEQLASDNIKKDWEKLKELTKECCQKNEVNGKILVRQKQIYGRLLEIMRGQSQSPSLYTATGAATSGHTSYKVDEA